MYVMYVTRDIVENFLDIYKDIAFLNLLRYLLIIKL